MKKGKFDIQLKVGLFVTIGCALTMISIILIGGPSLFFSDQARFHSYFSNSMGLIRGAKVVLDGIQVGTIDEISIHRERNKVRIDYWVNSDYLDWITENTIAEILTQGVLGDKYISLKNEALDSKTQNLNPEAEIPSAEGGGLESMLSDSGSLITRLNEVTSKLSRILGHFEEKNRDRIFFESLSKTTQKLSSITQSLDRELKDIKINSAVKHLDSILSKIDRGKGTVGALINDPALYDDVKALIGQANRNRVVRNLVRQTIREADQAQEETTQEKEAGSQPGPVPAGKASSTP